jgi:AcrR family transcriptional regulator
VNGFGTETTIGTRSEQREATRARLVDVGVEQLVARGHAALTTVAVQQAAGVSRGALLHHFRTREDLLTAVIERLLELHESAARDVLAATPPDTDEVRRAVTALHAVMQRPAFLAQLDLWTAARTDPDLARLVGRVERRAGHDLARVVDDAFGPVLTRRPGYRAIARLTVQVLRGLVLTDVLRTDPASADAAVDDWTAIVHRLLDPEEGSP